MPRSISRWLLRKTVAEPACLEREAAQRRELQSRVDTQLEELLAYLDRLSDSSRQNGNHGVSS